MKLIWQESHTRCITLGGNLTGASHKGKRPHAVEFTHRELDLIAKQLESPDTHERQNAIQYFRHLANQCKQYEFYTSISR